MQAKPSSLRPTRCMRSAPVTSRYLPFRSGWRQRIWRPLQSEQDIGAARAGSSVSESRLSPGAAHGQVKLPVLIIVLLLLVGAGQARACFAPPPALRDSPRALVASAKAIVVARVVASRPAQNGWHTTYSFQTERVVFVTPQAKAEVIPGFELPGFEPNDTVGIHGDFQGHTLPEFWGLEQSNASQYADCLAYGHFRVGETYLVILREGTHLRAYENVRRNDDLWLKSVELLVEQTKTPGA